MLRRIYYSKYISRYCSKLVFRFKLVGGSSCIQCPEGAECEGGLNPLALQSGFWADISTPLSVLKCGDNGKMAKNQQHAHYLKAVVTDVFPEIVRKDFLLICVQNAMNLKDTEPLVATVSSKN